LNWLAGDARGNGWWRAMLLQAIVTLVFVIAFGRSENGFTDLTVANAPFFWSFLGLTMVAMIVMRYRWAGQFTGYRTPLFPLLPLLFLATCGFMVYRSWTYLVFSQLTVPTYLMAGWLLLGVGLSFLLRRNSGDVAEWRPVGVRRPTSTKKEAMTGHGFFRNHCVAQGPLANPRSWRESRSRERRSWVSRCWVYRSSSCWPWWIGWSVRRCRACYRSRWVSGSCANTRSWRVSWCRVSRRPVDWGRWRWIGSRRSRISRRRKARGETARTALGHRSRSWQGDGSQSCDRTTTGK